MRVLLISTYELGRQPFGLASPAAWLRNAGADVTCLDLSRQAFDVSGPPPDLMAFHLPMHTATRLAAPVFDRVRGTYPDAQMCCYGLYAPLNAAWLRSRGVQHILGAEFEPALVELAAAIASGRTPPAAPAELPRPAYVTPDRSGLPPLSRYTSLQVGSERRTVGYTEASRGCKHTCRHCPVVPIYAGRFRVLPVDVVVEDVRAQVGSGARHITFGDPDFFNGPRHAMRVVEQVSAACPGVTYDVTIKVEHLLRHRRLLPRLRETGCLFVTSAVESFDDDVLRILDKRHTRADVEEALQACGAAGLTLSPTFIPFTPWTTLDGYCDLLAQIDRLGLTDLVAPIQLTLRLLVTEGSLLLGRPELRPYLGPFDAARLVYPWRHPDPRVDRFCEAVGALVGRRVNTPRRELFAEVWRLAHEQAGHAPVRRAAHPARRTDVPYLNEPWYC
ncbi:MAG: radical SAM protein [Acidobacteria bacterium]|nr:radical SAM protein [Acidobacteriota bacterium]